MKKLIALPFVLILIALVVLFAIFKMSKKKPASGADSADKAAAKNASSGATGTDAKAGSDLASNIKTGVSVLKALKGLAGDGDTAEA